MADKPTKTNGGKSKAEEGVLSSLSATRPARLSRRANGDAPAPARKPAAAKPAARKPAAAKPAASKPAATAKSAAAKPAAAKPRPKPAAKPEPKLEPVKAAVEEAAAPARRPAAVRPASDVLEEPIAEASARREEEQGRRAPGGAELVTTVVKAAGELASIGVTLGGQLLKRAASRLPKP